MARLAPAQLSAEEIAYRKREGTIAPNMQLVVAHSPEVARLQLELVRAAGAGMSIRQKELIILLIGLLTDNAYCWGHHVPVALDAGLTREQVLGIRGGDYASLPGEERTLLAYCRAVFDQNVTDDIWNAVSVGRTSEEMVKITMLIGFYCLLGKVQSAFDVTQDEGFGGFEQP